MSRMGDLYYINKIIVYKPFNVSLLHLINDDCEEFIVTASGVNYMTGYEKTDCVHVLTAEKYDRKKWEEIESDIEYERGFVR